MDEVVGEYAQLLPRAIGPVVVRGHDVERKLALRFGEVFSWAPRPHTKVNSAGRPSVMLVATGSRIINTSDERAVDPAHDIAATTIAWGPARS